MSIHAPDQSASVLPIRSHRNPRPSVEVEPKQPGRCATGTPGTSWPGFFFTQQKTLTDRWPEPGCRLALSLVLPGNA
ncbi:MAG: hypothetical protein C4343_00825 [Chloroflexota bacterium]